MRKSITLYSLTFSLPMLVWQVMFFLAPLVFLVAVSFWTVRNFRMEPDFNPDNWVRMLGRGVFWDAYFRTLILSSAAAVVTSVLAFPCNGPPGASELRKATAEAWPQVSTAPMR